MYSFPNKDIVLMEEILRQLRLVVYPIIYRFFFFYPRWWSPDFWTINSILAFFLAQPKNWIVKNGNHWPLGVSDSKSQRNLGIRRFADTRDTRGGSHHQSGGARGLIRRYGNQPNTTHQSFKLPRGDCNTLRNNPTRYTLPENRPCNPKGKGKPLPVPPFFRGVNC